MTKQELEQQVVALARRFMSGRMTVAQQLSQLSLVLADYFADTSCDPPKELSPSFCPECHGVELSDGVLESYPAILLVVCANGHKRKVPTTREESDAITAYQHAKYADVRGPDDA